MSTFRTDEKDFAMRSNSRWLLVLFATILTVSSTGCFRNPALKQLLDRPIIDYRDMVWARRAYNLRYGNCDRAFSNHFEEGFVAGYCDVCEGGDGYVPALPPDEYWSYEYQSPEGSQCVNAWFEGYPLGAAAARKDKVDKYQNIFISKMVDRAVTMEKAANVLPNDVPIKQNEEAIEQGDIHPDLKLETPPKPLGFRRGHRPTKKQAVDLLVSRSANAMDPVDPSDNAPLPTSLRPIGVRTAAFPQTNR